MRKIAYLAVDLGELKIANYYCEKINQIDKHFSFYWANDRIKNI